MNNSSFKEDDISQIPALQLLINMGKALEKTTDGDKKSFTLQYIDWKNPQNNIFHVTEEFNVMRPGSKEHYRPDLVLFINGISLTVIECKRLEKLLAN